MQLCINGHSHRIVEHTAGQVGIKLCHHIGQDLRFGSFQDQTTHTFLGTDGAPDLCQTDKPHLTGLIQFGCLVCRRATLADRIGHDRKQLAALGISTHQLSYVTHSGEGEGLLFYGSTILPFVDHFPKNTELYRIMTTKPQELKKKEDE